MHRVLLLVSVTIFGLILLSFADAPHQISYQGKVTDADGVGLNGNYNITFVIYGSETGSDTLWVENHTSVSVQKGLFSVILGETVPLDLPFDQQYWLEIWVDGTRLSPRQKFTSSPYAMYAEHAGAIPDTIRKGPVTFGAVLTLIDTTYAFGDNGIGLLVDSAGFTGIRVENSRKEGLSIFNSGRYGIFIDGTGDRGIFLNKPGSDGIDIQADSTSTHGIFIHKASDVVGCAPDTGLVVRDACVSAYFDGDVTIDGILSVASFGLDTIWSKNALTTDTVVAMAQFKTYGELIADSIQAVGDTVFVDDNLKVNDSLIVSGDEYVSGNIGVGTNSPSQELQVVGDAIVGGGATNNDGTDEFIEIQAQSENWYIGVRNLATPGNSDFHIGLTQAEDGIFHIQPDGNIGIGTTTPSYLLDVNGTGHFTGDVTIDAGLNDGTGLGTNGQYLMTDGSDAVWSYLSGSLIQMDTLRSVNGADADTIWAMGQFYVNGELIADSIQAVGDTVIIDDNLKVNDSLIVSGDEYVSGSVGITGTATVGGDLTISSGLNDGTGLGTNGQYLMTDGSDAVWSYLSGSLIQMDTLRSVNGADADTIWAMGQFYVNGELIADSIQAVGDTVIIDDNLKVNDSLIVSGDEYVSGNIGVGTNSPSQELQVVGDAIVGGGATNNDGTDEFIEIQAQSENWYIGVRNLATPGNSDFHIGLTQAEDGIFHIQPDGNIGIGTTTPSYLLDVNGTGHFTGDVTIDAGLNDGTGLGSPGQFLASTGSDVVWAYLTVPFLQFDTLKSLLGNPADTIWTLAQFYISGELIADSMQAFGDTIFIDDNLKVNDSLVVSGDVYVSRNVLVDNGNRYYGVDATQADSFWIYDDGDTTRFDAENPIKIGHNSLVVGTSGNVSVGGGMYVPIATVAADVDYTIASTDYTILVNTETDGTNTTITLPDATTSTGRIIIIKQISGSNNINLVTTETQTVDNINNPTSVLGTVNYAITLQSNDSNWYIISEKRTP